MSHMQSRRTFIRQIGTGMLGAGLLAPFSALFAENQTKKRFHIGACDWSIGKMAEVSGIEFAAQLGLDGIQVSVVNMEDQVHLNSRSVRQGI